MQDGKKKIQTRIEKELARLASTGKMLKGSINKVTLGGRKTGDGERESYLLTYKGEGNKTRTVYVEKDRVEEAKRMIGDYKKAKLALERIVELNVRLFKMK